MLTHIFALKDLIVEGNPKLGLTSRFKVAPQLGVLPLDVCTSAEFCLVSASSLQNLYSPSLMISSCCRCLLSSQCLVKKVVETDAAEGLTCHKFPPKHEPVLFRIKLLFLLEKHSLLNVSGLLVCLR